MKTYTTKNFYYTVVYPRRLVDKFQLCSLNQGNSFTNEFIDNVWIVFCDVK